VEEFLYILFSQQIIKRKVCALILPHLLLIPKTNEKLTLYSKLHTLIKTYLDYAVKSCDKPAHKNCNTTNTWRRLQNISCPFWYWHKTSNELW